MQTLQQVVSPANRRPDTWLKYCTWLFDGEAVYKNLIILLHFKGTLLLLINHNHLPREIPQYYYLGQQKYLIYEPVHLTPESNMLSRVYAQICQSLRCSHARNMDINEDSGQNVPSSFPGLTKGACVCLSYGGTIRRTPSTFIIRNPNLLNCKIINLQYLECLTALTNIFYRYSLVRLYGFTY